MKEKLPQVATAIVLVILALAILFREATRPRVPQGEPTLPSPAGISTGEDALAPGNPSGAGRFDTDNYLLTHATFATSYNNKLGIPNWSAWRLVKADLGRAPRGEFHADPDLPATFTRITPRDYDRSGFDRGHLCPSADRARSKEGTSGTFVMTNIIPQAPDLNQKGWGDLEDYCRRLAREGKTLYIVAGPQGVGGTGTAGPRVDLARGKVTVPAQCWKVVGVCDGEGPASLSRVIAVVMPNEQGVGHDWSNYRVPASRVEALTGYRFFDKAPPALAGPLKAQVDHVQP